jgi:hypothetical protein
MPPDSPLAEAVQRRLVRFGDPFTSGELERGEAELDAVPPNPHPPPEDEQAEPWGFEERGDEHKHRRFRDRLSRYRHHHGSAGDG